MEQRPVAGAFRLTSPVRRKSVYCSNGFADLTAVPGDECQFTDAWGLAYLRAVFLLAIPVRFSIHHPCVMYGKCKIRAVTGDIHPRDF